MSDDGPFHGPFRAGLSRSILHLDLDDSVKREANRPSLPSRLISPEYDLSVYGNKSVLMAGQQFEYDERGSTFYYFIVSFYALVLIPATYYFWPKDKKKDTGSDKRCRCVPCERKEELKRAKEPKKRLQHWIVRIVLLIGWLGFVFLAYQAAHAEVEVHEYDPYAILGVDRGASVEEIKKQYRKLSLKHHPDRGGDSKLFVAITKAHQALTDDEARKNWEQYGNPDGPGALRFGIALPSWLVSKEYGFFVLAAYGLVFMVVLPTVVGIWWYRSIKYSADQVLMDTTRNYFYLIIRTSFLNTKRLLAILGGSFEFWKMYNKEIVERPSDNEEVPKLLKKLPTTFAPARKEKPPYLGMEYSVKARALLYAHLSRLELPLNTLEKDRQYVIRKIPLLIQELIQVYYQLVYMFQTGRVPRLPSLETLDNIFKLSPMIVQARWENKSPLLQLPHLTEDMLRHCINKKRYIKTCADLAHMPEQDRLTILSSLPKQRCQDVLNVLSTMPHIEMNVRVEVQDEEDKQTVTAGAVVTVVVSLKRTPLMDVSNIKPMQTTSTSVEKSFQNEDDGTPVENVNGEEVSDADNPDQDEMGEQNAAANNQKKRPVWEKQKKGKKGGAKKKKPAPQKHHAVSAAKAAAEAAVKTAEAEEKTASPRKRKPKEADDDGDESGSESSEDEDVPLDEHLNQPDSNDEEDDFLVDEMGPKEKMLETKSKVTHLVHCPYFPEEKYEWWWVYLCDRKNRMLICPPASVTTLVTEEEVQLKFPAPRKGTYTYQVCLRSDSYLDADQNKDIKIQVHEAKEITSHPQWNFPSEDEEEKKSEQSDAASEYTEEEENEDDNAS